MQTTDRIDLADESEEIRRRRVADHFASIGVITGGIAHDLGNPLNALMSALTVMKRDLAHGETARVGEALAFACEAVEQIEALVLSVKAALYPSDGKPVDVADAIGAAVKLAAPEIRARARLDLDVTRGALVIAERSRLVQVFLKVLINAAQSIGEGATDRNAVRVSARRDGGSVVVEISDTGHGMPPHVLRRIFEPFYSTKAPARGAGLGLFVCREIVTGLGGSISAQSTEGRGTTFRVSLPAHGEPARAATGSEPSSGIIARARRSAIVLVVDDDPEIGTSLQDCLTPEHHVDVTTDPRYALARLTAGIPYDLIVCDVDMPGMSGPELHARASALPGNPGAAFVFMTGGENPRYARENGVEVLRKPFRVEQLRALISAKIGAFSRARPA